MAAAAGDLKDDGGGLFAGRRSADRHDVVESLEGRDLPPALRPVLYNRAQRLG